MRRLKFRFRAKNTNSPATPGLSPTLSLSPGAVSAMRVTVSDANNPSPEWRRRKNILRFSQFREVREDLKSTILFDLTSIISL